MAKAKLSVRMWQRSVFFVAVFTKQVGSRPLNRTSKTLKQIGRSSRRAHRVALPSARSRKTGLDFARPRQIWTTSFRKKKIKK